LTGEGVDPGSAVPDDDFTLEGARPIRILLATSRDWLASALRAVLEPQGFEFEQADSGRRALRRAAHHAPDAVIVDEGLPDVTAPELCRQLTERGLRSSTPLLVYTPSCWHESEQVRAMQAGAWDVIREPIRSGLLVAKLKRLLQIKGLIELSEGTGALDSETGVFSLEGLVELLPGLASIAQRADAAMSCAVLGPTEPATSLDQLEQQRQSTALLCRANTRASDLCAWIGPADLVLVAYDADVRGASEVVRRLSALAEGSSERDSLSAGVVDFSPSHAGEADGRLASPASSPAGAISSQRIASLLRLVAAQEALHEARGSGGGIHIA
jgi:CheY-like chemotaxis protein